MKRFVEGEDRRQATLLPDCLDDYVTEDNPVRFVEAFIDELDLAALGFAGIVPEVTGRPAYHPATLLKIYIYGYLNRIQSSRRLERETQRNLELIWLTGRLMPDFKTIADFRRDNGPAIRAACAQFVVLCRKLNLFTRAVVAIDGSKFKAVNNRDKNFTVAKVAKRIEQVEASIARYLAALDRADRQDNDVAEAKTARLKEKIEGLRRSMQSLKEMQQQVEAAPDQQISLTESGCPFNGHQRQGHRHCWLQRPDGGGGRAPPHRGARGDQCRQRPHPTARDGTASPRRDGVRGSHGAG
jgi:transposase